MTNQKRGIAKTLLKMTILPLLILGIVTTLFSIVTVSHSMETEVQKELTNLAGMAVESIESLYPGDYCQYGSEDSLLFTKGDTILNQNYDLLDAYKAKTNTEYSIFYGDMRVITTICDSDGTRLVGTSANYQVIQDVLKNQQSAFYNNVDIFGVRFYGYYEPLLNSDGTCVGMFAALMPADSVRSLIFHTSLPIFLISLTALVFVSFWIQKYARDFNETIQKLKDALKKVSVGELSNTVPPRTLARKDEFGEMAHSIIDMQTALRSLIELDGLTGIYNRRCGQQKLDRIVAKAKEDGSPYFVALGDVDFFKKFNDAYGHDCGDLVLATISKQLQNFIKHYGFCCRWGGEEFLLVFTSGDLNTNKLLMEQLMDEIRALRIPYGEETLSITMTFGFVDGRNYQTTDDVIKAADQLLYDGKASGRDKLVL